jgi:hypothetical protein
MPCPEVDEACDFITSVENEDDIDDPEQQEELEIRLMRIRNAFLSASQCLRDVKSENV